MLSGIDVSYKTVERLYSDEEVQLAIHNLHVLILGRNSIQSSDAAGDGTGYSLSVKKNYESHAQKLKDLAKENPGKDADGNATSTATKQVIFQRVVGRTCVEASNYRKDICIDLSSLDNVEC